MNKGGSSCATKIVGSVDSPSLTTNRYTIPRSSPHGHAIRNEHFSNNSSASAQVLPRMDNKSRLLHYSPQQFPQRSANAAIAASSTLDKHNNDHGHYTPPPFTHYYAQKETAPVTHGNKDNTRQFPSASTNPVIPMAPFPEGEHNNPAYGQYTPQFTPPSAKDKDARTKSMPFPIDLLVDTLMDEGQEGLPLKYLDSSSSYQNSIIEEETEWTFSKPS